MKDGRILIIDNGSIYLNELQRLCKPALCTIVKPGDIKIEEAETYALIFLSGGYQHEVMGSDEFYRTEIELIKHCRVPIIGICLGFQLIAHSFGMPIHKMPRTEHMTLAIYPTKQASHVLGKERFHVYEDHRWVLSKVPANFHALAYSKDGIEVIRHNSLPLVGFQFHPEMFVTTADGRAILRNIVSELNARR
ncbi:MAG: gamma-glutamyl-gamma-aminobutyrate hydrolase family protein [Patescibacteria group bacterium]